MPAHDTDQWVASAGEERCGSLIVISDESEVRAQAAKRIEWGLSSRGLSVRRVPWGKIAAAAGRDKRLLDAGLFDDPWSSDVTRQMREAPFLVIEDLGLGQPDYYELAGFFGIVDERHMQLRPTAVTTSLDREALFRQFAVEDEEILAERILWRLYRHATVVVA